MELYLSLKSSGRQDCIPLISEVAAVVLDDQGREIATFETAPGDSGAALLAFLDRYPRAELHPVHDADWALFQGASWNLGNRVWGEGVVTAARAVLERMDADVLTRTGHQVATLDAMAHSFGLPSEEPSGPLAAARLGARLHAVVKDRRAACDVEEDEVTHMMEQGL